MKFVRPFLVIIFVLLLSSNLLGQASDYKTKNRSNESSALWVKRNCLTTHKIGNLGLTVSNLGIFGTGFDGYTGGRPRDCFTGLKATSCEIGQGSGTSYLYGGTIWVGAILGTDTLVSSGSEGWGNGIKFLMDNGGYEWHNMEFYPEDSDDGFIKRYSILNQLSPASEGAVSEEDIVAVYTDTVTIRSRSLQFDTFEGRYHIPLGLKITQSSYAWSYAYADDFILIDFQIENISDSTLREAYFGLYLDVDAWGNGNRDRSLSDDITGFEETRTYSFKDCEFTDTINLAWFADNNGDHNKPTPVPGALGTRFLRAPESSYKNVSYNWWTSSLNPALDFGPRYKPTEDHPWRDLKTGGLGTPQGDINKYDFLSNHERDYNQIRIPTISPLDTTFMYPNKILARYIPRGYDIGYLQSVGPFSIAPGEILYSTIAFVSEPNFHHQSRNYQHHLQIGTYEPDEYMAGLNWKDFKTNATWASWVFDNPGYDSNNDGYSGRFHLCCNDSTILSIDSSISVWDTIWEYDICDTLYYEGDRIPDYKGASPPPAPDFWVEPSIGAINIRWNGFRSENTRDLFSNKYDFDGYRVYYALDDRQSSYTLLATYDLENYIQWMYNSSTNQFEFTDDPYSAEELRCLYGDSCLDDTFDPAFHTQYNPFLWGDSILYFSAQDYNMYELGVTTPITKIYPSAPEPPYKSTAEVPEELRELYLTEDGYFKYYEYQHRIEDLLPTVTYFINVTAYDYGSPKSGLGSLETSLANGAIEAYAHNSVNKVAQDDLKVFIYPNPYRINENYLEKGYEGRDALYYIPDRMRRIHFANLAPKCTIGIYSLDGDLVRKLEHDVDPSDPLASHEEWNMITRNTQAVVTGIYYWVVTNEDGSTQMGKLVVIK